MASLEGQSLGRYHLLEKIGEGGMATVYKARDTRLDRHVAVKIIRMDNFSPNMLESVLERFEREARSLAQLSHPYIVKVIDFGEYQGAPYLVLEYLSGGTLKQLIGQPIPYPQAARLLLPIARALAYAHGEGLVHRDVKPSNILLSQGGEPLLADFGIAKILEGVGRHTLTGSGVAVGTPDYMAPEQWLGEVGPQTDIYALGVVFFELLTGRKPFEADTPAGLLLKQTSSPIPKAYQYIPDLPRQVDQVLEKAMQKEVGDRYKTMGDFARALEKLALLETGEAPDSTGSATLPLDATHGELPDKAREDRELIALRSRVEQAISLEAWEQANALVDRMSSSGRLSTREMQVLKGKIARARQETERMASRISRLEKVTLESLSVEDFEDAEEHLLSLERLGPNGQQMAEHLREEVSRQREEARLRDGKIASLAARVAQAIDIEDLDMAEKAVAEMEQLGPKAQAEANRLKSPLEAHREHVRQRKARVSQLSQSVQEALEREAWEEALRIVAELPKHGKEGELEAANLKSELERRRLARLEELCAWVQRDMEAEAYGDVEQWLVKIRQLGKEGQAEAEKLEEELEEARRQAVDRAAEIDRLKTAAVSALREERWERAGLFIDQLAGLGAQGRAEAERLEKGLEEKRKEASERHAAPSDQGTEVRPKVERPKPPADEVRAAAVRGKEIERLEAEFQNSLTARDYIRSKAVIGRLQKLGEEGQARAAMLQKTLEQIQQQASTRRARISRYGLLGGLAASVFCVLLFAGWVVIRDPWNWRATLTPMPSKVSQVSPSTVTPSRAVSVTATAIRGEATASPILETTRPALPTPSLTMTRTPTPMSSFQVVVSVDAARLRGGPGTMYGVVDYLEASSTLEAVGRNAEGDWLVVNHRGGTAWVSTKVVTFNFDVKLLPEVEPPPTPRPPPPTSTESGSSGGPQPTQGKPPTWTPPP